MDGRPNREGLKETKRLLRLLKNILVDITKMLKKNNKTFGDVDGYDDMN